MKDFAKNFISVINDYADDYGTDGVLDEIFPGMSLGEILYQHYELGGIPEDVLEKFLSDGDNTTDEN